MKEKLESYYNLLDQWLKYYGFEPITVHSEAGADKVFRRSRVEPSKFGKVDAYVCAKYMHEGATGDEMKMYSEKMFTLANSHRSGGIPLGFGAMLLVYPLLVTDNISNELAAFINTYCPKHFAAAEFPSVLDLTSGHLYFYPKTPIWGYAYYAGYRREVYNMFSPQAWEQVAGKR